MYEFLNRLTYVFPCPSNVIIIPQLRHVATCVGAFISRTRLLLVRLSYVFSRVYIVYLINRIREHFQARPKLWQSIVHLRV